MPTVVGHLAIDLRNQEAGNGAHACAMITQAAMQLTGTDTWSERLAISWNRAPLTAPTGAAPVVRRNR